MRAVDVRVRHDDDAVIAQLLDIEVLGADAAPERRDHRLDLVAAQHLVEARLLDVENLPLDRQDRLELAVPSLLRRSSGRLAFDDVDLAVGGIALLTVGEFPRQRAVVERAFAAHEIACLAGGLTGACGIDGLGDDALGHRRVLFQVGAELVVDDRLDDTLDLGVAQLRLRLPLELRPRDLDADDRHQAFADVVAADVGVFQVLRHVVLADVGVDRARQRGAKAGKMRSSLVGVDVVGERVDRLRIAVVPLQGNLDVDAFALAVHVDRLVVDRDLVLIQVLDERVDASLIQELVRFSVALVIDRDRDAAVEEGELAQALGQRVEAVFGGLEDLRVGLKGDLGAALLRRPRDFEPGRRIAALVALVVDLPVAPDLELEVLRQRVHDRDADAVQTTGHFVALVVELAAGVEHGKDDFRRRAAARVLIDWDAASVVDDGN